MESFINRYSDGTPFVPNWILQTKGMQAIAEKLAKYEKYEELEEQGLLLKLPCEVGTTVYHIVKGRILETEADSFFLTLSVVEGRFGKNVFLTLEEAERKLLEERNMKVQEAIEIISNAIQTDNMTVEQDKALAVMQKAVEKQVPKKPNLWGDGYADGELVYDMYSCPNCEVNYEIDEEHDYCPNCGQKLDWSEADE